MVRNSFSLLYHETFFFLLQDWLIVLLYIVVWIKLWPFKFSNASSQAFLSGNQLLFGWACLYMWLVGFSTFSSVCIFTLLPTVLYGREFFLWFFYLIFYIILYLMSISNLWFVKFSDMTSPKYNLYAFGIAFFSFYFPLLIDLIFIEWFKDLPCSVHMFLLIHHYP